MDIGKYIDVNPNICHGKPCFKGTRIMVSIVLELLESGKSFREIRKGYPPLTPNHIRAALHLAHQLLEQGQFFTFQTLSHAVSH